MTWLYFYNDNARVKKVSKREDEGTIADGRALRRLHCYLPIWISKCDGGGRGRGHDSGGKFRNFGVRFFCFLAIQIYLD